MPIKPSITARLKRFFFGSQPKQSSDANEVVGKCSKCEIMRIYVAELQAIHKDALKRPKNDIIEEMPGQLIQQIPRRRR